MAAIKQARPEVLLVAADGPREDPRCTQVRDHVLAAIDWPCRVQTRFLDELQGCRKAVSSALDWAFGLHEQLIILEDDCLPHPSFFVFCAAMLDRFKNSPEVMQICGSNLTGMRSPGHSYCFSRFGPIWGWASWRRAWQAYDVAMKEWPAVRDSPLLRQCCPEPCEAAWRREVLGAVYRGEVDTWDYQWAFAKLRLGGLNIVPSVNLISNIGFGPDATHTLNSADPRAGLAVQDLPSPLQHPATITAWQEADRAYLTQVVGLPAKAISLQGMRRWVRSLFKR
ncbi:glycosyltransferase family 2 protein [Prosthecobacter sp.]|uniref:glycosyltransferase family 2 protein n=1 Tax=Prosthecobacter sp. TaxID=1965333 RepID=UPI003782D6F0